MVAFLTNKTWKSNAFVEATERQRPLRKSLIVWIKKKPNIIRTSIYEMFIPFFIEHTFSPGLMATFTLLSTKSRPGLYLVE
jgi:hypothetical protein